MTATEELRRMLDERRVKWGNVRNDGSESDYFTEWELEGIKSYAVANEWSVGGVLSVETRRYSLTPEQAIEATLGNEESYTRDDVESAFVSGYSLGCLPVGSDPQWDQNEQTVDEHMAELGWVRAATLCGPKAKAHPYGYEPDTGAFDVTRCECGCLNDISATYCNDCGGEIEIDMNAEKEIYHRSRHLVFAEKHDDGSLEFAGKRYIAATLGETDESCYIMRDGKKFPVELDYGFVGIMPIAITVGGFRYLLEVPNGE